MRLMPLLLLSAVHAVAAASDFVISPDHPDARYKVHESVVWTVTGGPADAVLPYTIKSCGRTEIAKGNLSFINGKAVVTAKLDSPGALLCTVKIAENKKLLSCAVVDHQDIKPAAPEPADFDTFWQAKLKELATVPANPILEEVDSGSPAVQLWKITIDSIRGSKIQGYLARPKGNAKLPAMLQLQHAGTLGLKKEWVTGPAKNGWLALNILAHDLPVGREDEFYRQQLDGPLKDYLHQGGADRDKSYFLRMNLSAYRAVDYLTRRTDWNRATLLTQGVSMGGMQSLVVAGLHPAVTAVTVDVPAGCDQNGAALGRAPGFPWWVSDPSRAQTAGYYDPANFAKRIRCPALVGMGLIDNISPPAGVLAMFNQIPSPKRVVMMPTAEHTGNHSAYEEVKRAWWKAAAAGQPLPVK